MSAAAYVPEAGDIVWLDFDPQSGREQAGHRPGVVISAASYNRRTGLMLCCPMTTRVKGFPFEVRIAGERDSVVLADHVRSVDWRTRRAAFKGCVGAEELLEIRAKLRALIG